MLKQMFQSIEFFCDLTTKNIFVITVATDSPMLWLLLNYFRIVAFNMKTLITERYPMYFYVWLKKKTIWSRVPDMRLTLRETDRLLVGRAITLTDFEF
jgi:hypothetical protein